MNGNYDRYCICMAINSVFCGHLQTVKSADLIKLMPDHGPVTVCFNQYHNETMSQGLRALLFHPLSDYSSKLQG